MVKVSSDKVLLALMLVNFCCCCFVETNFAGKELNIDKRTFSPPLIGLIYTGYRWVFFYLYRILIFQVLKYVTVHCSG